MKDNITKRPDRSLSTLQLLSIWPLWDVVFLENTSSIFYEGPTHWPSMELSILLATFGFYNFIHGFELGQDVQTIDTEVCF